MCRVDFAMHLDKSTITHLTEQLGTIYDVGWGKFKGRCPKTFVLFSDVGTNKLASCSDWLKVITKVWVDKSCWPDEFRP